MPLIERADKAPEAVIVLDDADPSKQSSVTVQNTTPSCNDCPVELTTVTLGTPLPSFTYLSLSVCISTLDSADESTSLTNVPTGVKSNMYFVASAQENENHILKGQRRVFRDECGAWASARGFNSLVVGGSRIMPKLLSNCQTIWQAPWMGPSSLDGLIALLVCLQCSCE